MPQRIGVRFAGQGAGAADLSWGQREIWLRMRAQRSSMPLGGVVPLVPGVSSGDVAAELAFLMSRHQTLRTRLRFSGSRIQQVVSASGEASLEVVDAGTGGDPARAASAVQDRYLGSEFDYAGEWPVRCAVVTRREVPEYLVLAICHLAEVFLQVCKWLRWGR